MPDTAHIPADPHAAWLAAATADLRAAAGDAVELEQRLAMWIHRGRGELGGDLNLRALIGALRLPALPDGTAADARLRRLQKLSEAAYGAVLRAEAWQSDVLYLCDQADGRLFARLHGRTLAILEDPDWDGGPMEAARWAVSTYIAEQGLEPDLDAPVPKMAEIQRASFDALDRNIRAFEAVMAENRG